MSQRFPQAWAISLGERSKSLVMNQYSLATAVFVFATIKRKGGLDQFFPMVYIAPLVAYGPAGVKVDLAVLDKDRFTKVKVLAFMVERLQFDMLSVFLCPCDEGNRILGERFHRSRGLEPPINHIDVPVMGLPLHMLHDHLWKGHVLTGASCSVVHLLNDRATGHQRQHCT